jgi:hypothetical protein
MNHFSVDRVSGGVVHRVVAFLSSLRSEIGLCATCLDSITGTSIDAGIGSVIIHS